MSNVWDLFTCDFEDKFGFTLFLAFIDRTSLSGVLLLFVAALFNQSLCLPGAFGCTLSSPLWIDPGLKSGISVHELISTSKKEKKRRQGREQMVEHSHLPKSLQARKKPPPPSSWAKFTYGNQQFKETAFSAKEQTDGVAYLYPFYSNEWKGPGERSETR